MEMILTRKNLYDILFITSDNILNILNNDFKSRYFYCQMYKIKHNQLRENIHFVQWKLQKAEYQSFGNILRHRVKKFTS